MGAETANPQISPLTVAICIGTYNQAQYLRGSIESAMAQSYPIAEYWVADDASTDNTDEVMQELCREYPQIRYYRQPKNLGLPGNLSWLFSPVFRLFLWSPAFVWGAAVPLIPVPALLP